MSDEGDATNVGAYCTTCETKFVTASTNTVCPFCGARLKAFHSLTDEDRNPERPWETP